MHNRPFFYLFCFLFSVQQISAQVILPFDVKEQDSIFSLQQLRHNGSANTPPLSVYKQAVSAPSAVCATSKKNNKITTTICNDTSARIFLINDTVIHYPGDPYPLADGNFLLPGLVARNILPFKEWGFLIKFDVDGNVIWDKRFDSLDHVYYNSINYYKVLELQDGSILLAGYTNNLVSGNRDLILTKTDSNGNLIWSKVYKSRLWGQGSGSPDFYNIQQMKQDPVTGEVYICGPFWYYGNSLIKMDPANGNFLWSKAYSTYAFSFDRCFGFDIRQNDIRLFCRYWRDNYGYIAIRTIDKVTGDTIQNKYFGINDTAAQRLQFSANEPLRKLNNGHYIIAGACSGGYVYNWDGVTPLFQGAYSEFDENLNFVQALAFKNSILSNQGNTRVTVFPDGTGFFSMLHYISSYTADVYYVQFDHGQLIKQRVKHYAGEGDPYDPPAIRLPDGGDMLIRVIGDSALNLSKLELLKLHVSDTASSCLGYDDQNTFLYPYQFVPTQSGADSVRSNVFQENPNKTITVSPFNVNKYPACYQVSHCDSLHLQSSASTICVSQSLLITGHRNPGCGSNISWQYNNTVVSSASLLNDSTLSLQFNTNWSGYIYGSIEGCSIITDSVLVNVLQAPSALNLGPDTSICPSNTITLNAHSGYASYHWQDGSTDSIFTVIQPGIYYINAINACGANFNDTVAVTAHMPVALYAGPDRTKCNNDTLDFTAPGGFITYHWSPDYNINSLSQPSVTVNPLTDTTYYLSAEQPAGCFAYDTIHVVVQHSPSIHLGSDTSLCFGQSFIFDAGGGFTSYTWNTGDITQVITAHLAGYYFVSATSTNNCKSTDTIQIKNIYPIPTVNLDHDSTLCANSVRVLNAGSFNTYLWQDGSLTSNFTVNAVGTYYVDVIDAYGCRGSDTVKIMTILPLPGNFLSNDTSLCNFQKMIVGSNNIYQDYLWNTSSTSQYITIQQPGLYWLQVTDKNGCVGKDSVNIKPKECIKGLYVPAAFTPNGDINNENLKGLLFGNIMSYEFSVYNRYGQLLFKTNNVYEGWDGKYKGMQEAPGAYVWFCKYQLSGTALTTARGTTLLIR